ncbi:MAG: helix-turn-helix domain-containing protein [Herpetosiphonaceae bacterium]|nr:helix-turn-helix domain-containing protein [Herpetosiphonaceae bacterium]
MSIGERIKSARVMARLSQRDLGEAAGVSAMAISKYERNQDAPGSGVLLNLAHALDIKLEYFFRPVTVSVSRPTFRCHISLSRGNQDRILLAIQEWLERYLEVESLFENEGCATPFSHFRRAITSMDDIEQAALGLREEWHLGDGPIDGLMEVIEAHGIKVGLVVGQPDFDACTFWVNDTLPVIAVKGDVPGDRQRFNLAYELGHLVLDIPEELDAEKAAHRFATAFLVPATDAQCELGLRRRNLGEYELHLLKHKYGMSMQDWVCRAKDLGVLSEQDAGRLFGQFRKRGWREIEPGDVFPPEESGRMKRLVLRALSEDMISESRAAELLGMPLAAFYAWEAEQHGGFPVALSL